MIWEEGNDSKNQEEFEEIKKNLESENFKRLENCTVYDICILPNDGILATTNDSIRIFNEKFEEIVKKEIYQGYANGCELSPNKDNIYISNHHDSCIDLYDMSLNKQHGKSIGSEGRGKYQFYGIGLMTCYNSNLYVCDKLNRRIQVLKTNKFLEFIDSIDLNDIPYTIKISNGVIGLCCNGGTYFYDLESKNIKIELNSFDGTMNLINSIFVVIQSNLIKDDPGYQILIFDFKSNSFKSEIMKISRDYIDEKNLINYQIINYKNGILLFSSL